MLIALTFFTTIILFLLFYKENLLYKVWGKIHA